MSTVNLDDIRDQVEILKATKRKMAALKELHDNARAKVEEALGEAEFGTLDGDPVVSWRHQKSSRLNQKALKEERPEIVAEYTETTSGRRFEVLD